MSKKKEVRAGSSTNFSMRVREFCIPPVTDALVLGSKSPIGSEGMQKALALMNGTPFEHISLDDPIISDILVRSSILKRITREKFSELVLERVKPLMSPEEVLHLDLEVELLLEGTL